MNSENSRIKTLSDYASHRTRCDKQQLANIRDAFNYYLDEIENYIKKIRAEKGYSVDNINSVLELASRLRALVDLDLVLSTSLSVSTHFEKELELLENDNEKI